MSTGLFEYRLEDEEWEAISGLTATLKLLKDATMFFSSNAVSVAQVIPAMDAIDEALASGMIDNQAVSQPIHHALAIGKKTMNKYYALTDDSDIYRMAIILHPQRKLNYFTNANWTQDWIDSVVEITRRAWEHFKPSDVLDSVTGTLLTADTNVRASFHHTM
ncbi:hypothetical protein EV360DRAFT_56900 [Lentinula raphanica]|nr:hypothetical protein EV360DRAFT_56900 [Lentinula raphanica]